MCRIGNAVDLNPVENPYVGCGRVPGGGVKDAGSVKPSSSKRLSIRPIGGQPDAAELSDYSGQRWDGELLRPG